MKKLLQYFVVGGSSAILDFLIFYILTSFIQIHWSISALISFSIATALNYYLCISFVFVQSSRFKKHQEVILVYFVSGIGLTLNLLCLYLLIELLNTHLLISKIVATGSVFIWNFLIRNNFIFKPRKV
jgi:putative flippase GtrA